MRLNRIVDKLRRVAGFVRCLGLDDKNILSGKGKDDDLLDFKLIDLLIAYYLEEFPREIETEKNMNDDFWAKVLFLIFAKKAYKSLRSVRLLLSEGLEQDAVSLARSLAESVTDLYLIDKVSKCKLSTLYISMGTLFDLGSRRDLIYNTIPEVFSSKKDVNPHYWCGMSVKERCKRLVWDEFYEKFYKFQSDFVHTGSLSARSFYGESEGKILFVSKDCFSDMNKFRYTLFNLASLDVTNMAFAIFDKVGRSLNFGVKRLEALEKEMEKSEYDFIILQYLEKGKD